MFKMYLWNRQRLITFLQIYTIQLAFWCYSDFEPYNIHTIYSWRVCSNDIVIIHYWLLS